MRKITQDELGGPEVLRLVEVEAPAPGPTEILVETRAIGVNPVDWKARTNGGSLGAPPFTVGWEVAGIVAATGVGVTRFAVGDEVFGMPWFPQEAAAYAEFVTGPARHFTGKPPNLTFEEAAGLGLAGLTALQALVETAAVLPGQRVLIPAAAGGVGHLAVQVAKMRGAYVIGTASAAKHDLVRSLGADQVLDHHTEDYSALEDIDVVLATVGGRIPELAATLRPEGLIVALNSEDAQAVVDVEGVLMLVEPDRAGLDVLAAHALEGELRVLVEQVFPLAEAGRAHAIGEAGHTTGKLILRP
ncbi:NADP-dependent oxidoreductase [Dactylosporangium vinaceum]|uniref:NADP-dependent oxidoreductase n=1 Tax=Dactylosporangium vinaceum TaxID=53362 RepID=A0ABV5M8P3_9ACTN|nr:NADP-dependent oxidoreductase [Dactylosporangium vinaceum]UAB94607.1 NADP-dependent oxidoreductase [Dactylosporangium vinaceum]